MKVAITPPPIFSSMSVKYHSGSLFAQLSIGQFSSKPKCSYGPIHEPCSKAFHDDGWCNSINNYAEELECPGIFPTPLAYTCPEEVSYLGVSMLECYITLHKV
jgi:hypothetical protein